MKIARRLVLALFLVTASLPSFSEEASTEPVPYKKEEFPQWMRDLRRAEIISLGAVPFALLSYSFGKSCFDCVTHGFNTSYIKSPIARSTDSKDLKAAFYIGFGIGATDFLINTIRRRNRIKREKAALPSSVYIEEYDEDAEGTPIVWEDIMTLDVPSSEGSYTPIIFFPKIQLSSEDETSPDANADTEGDGEKSEEDGALDDSEEGKE